MRRLFLIVFALLSLLAVPPHAAAQSEAPDAGHDAGHDASHDAGNEAMTDQARQLHIKGSAYFKKGQWAKAHAAFAAAWAIKQHYQIAGALGACELKLNKFRDAAEHLAYFLRGFPDSGDPEERKQTAVLLARARAKVGTIQLTITAPQLELQLDGQPLELGGATELFVEPGKHELRVQVPGQPASAVAIELSAGQQKQVTVPPPTSTNGAPEGGGKSPVLLWSTIAAAGLCVVAFGVGGALRAVGSGKKSDADARRVELDQAGVRCPGGCDELEELYGKADTRNNASTGMFIVGGAAAAAAVTLLVLYLTSDVRDTHEAAVRPQVVASPQGAGLGLTFRY